MPEQLIDPVIALLCAYCVLVTIAAVTARRPAIAQINAFSQRLEAELDEAHDYSNRLGRDLAVALAAAENALCDQCGEIASIEHKGRNYGWHMGRMRNELHDAMADRDSFQQDLQDTRWQLTAALRREKLRKSINVKPMQEPRGVHCMRATPTL